MHAQIGDNKICYQSMPNYIGRIIASYSYCFQSLIGLANLLSAKSYYIYKFYILKE